jgi:hypothetical protein
MTNLPASLSCLLLLLATALPAQQCFDFGSQPVPQQFEASPFLLGCPRSTGLARVAPADAGPRRAGPARRLRPGRRTRRDRACWWHYRCTGFLLLPVLPAPCALSGYVIHQPEFACTPLIP